MGDKLEPFEYINNVYCKANIELFEAQINIQHVQYSILENYNKDSKVLYEGTLKDTGKKIIDIIKRFFNNIIRAMERWIAKILSCFSNGLIKKINTVIDDYGFTVPELRLDEINKEFSNVINDIETSYINLYKLAGYIKNDTDDSQYQLMDNIYDANKNIKYKLQYLKNKFNSSEKMVLDIERAQLNLYKESIRNVYEAENRTIYNIEAYSSKYGTNLYLIQWVRSVYFPNTRDFVNIIQRRAQIAAMSIIKAAKIAIRGSKANTIDINKIMKIYNDANKSFSDIMEDTPKEFGIKGDF